jgi:cell fate regulator YaaT (PSP1 superfamily)
MAVRFDGSDGCVAAARAGAGRHRGELLVPIVHGGPTRMSGCGGCSFRGMSTAVESAYVGVRFAEETNLTLCATEGQLFARGARVIVDVEGEPAFGHVEQSPMTVFKPCQKAGAKKILRPASDEDSALHERQRERQASAKIFVQERARALSLDMKVSRVDFTLSGKKASVFFTAEHRVDFRQLVRDIAHRFGTRVQMVQLGARDEAGLLGGLGVCGRTLCCSSWLKEFRPISIQMAKRQNLSLNPSKISGQCGRLLCCLAYEDDQYKGGRKTKEEPPAAEPS